jgi:hypothetical protein
VIKLGCFCPKIFQEYITSFIFRTPKPHSRYFGFLVRELFGTYLAFLDLNTFVYLSTVVPLHASYALAPLGSLQKYHRLVPQLKFSPCGPKICRPRRKIFRLCAENSSASPNQLLYFLPFQKTKTTTPCIPMWSPTIVLTRP